MFAVTATIGKCSACGLLKVEENRSYCLRFKQEIEAGRLELDTSCLYYFPIKTEAGEPLSAEQHLIIQDGELRRKKMRGPV